MPKVSIIVPIYNAEAFLPMCITSLTHQTHEALEIILVNDGSTDHSLAIAKQFADSDARIVILSQDNQGQSAARNKGLEIATGEYIMFVDADDYIDSDYIDRHRSAIGDADYVQSGYRRVSSENEILDERLPRHRFQFTSPCMRLYRASFIREHQLTFPIGMIYEDVIFSLNLWGCRPRCQSMDYCGYNYTFNPSSTTSVVNREAQKILYRAIKSSSAPRWLKRLTVLRLYIHFLRKR